MENRAAEIDGYNGSPPGVLDHRHGSGRCLWPHLGGVLALLLALTLAACDGRVGDGPSQSPSAYVNGALDWIQVHDYWSAKSDWDAIRREALQATDSARTTAGTYDGINLALNRLGDRSAFFVTPNELDNGGWYAMQAVFPGAVIVVVEPRGPADRAGIRVGDVIEGINGEPPSADGAAWGLVDLHEHQSEHPRVELTIRRPGQAESMAVTLSTAVTRCLNAPRATTYRRGSLNLGYLSLPTDCENDDGYPAATQAAMRRVDADSSICGWVLDLRQTIGGNIWRYLAAVGPVLGDGDLGAFVYADGRRETWSYRNGRVYSADNTREELRVDGALYHPRNAMPPVALLTGLGTINAGELVVVAFAGRPGARRFGEPTQGIPFLLLNTFLSDGAGIWLGAAVAADRTEQTYSAAIQPDQAVKVNPSAWWTDGDAALNAALDWLARQPECAP